MLPDAFDCLKLLGGLERQPALTLVKGPKPLVARTGWSTYDRRGYTFTLRKTFDFGPIRFDFFPQH